MSPNSSASACEKKRTFSAMRRHRVQSPSAALFDCAPLYDADDENYNAKRMTSRAVFCVRRCIIISVQAITATDESREESGNDNEKKLKKKK